MENIVINFSSDPSGLQPGIDGLVQMGVVSDENAKKFKSASDQMNTGAKQTASEIGKLVDYFSKLDKSIVGGAYTKSLKDLETAVSGVSDKYKAMQVAVDAAKKKQAEFKPNSQEWKALQTQIESAEKVISSFKQEEEAADQKTQSLRAQLRQLKQDLALMEEQGKENTKEFEQMSIQAARLEDQLGDTAARIRGMASDTANIDAVVQGVQAMASGFQLAAGAQALFGSEDEALQKTLVKLNGIMAVTAAIQQLQQAVQKETILVIKAESVAQTLLNFVKTGSLTARKAETAATTAQAEATVAETEATVASAAATTGAATAMQVLRAAVIATGIGALVVLLAVLVSKLSEVASHAKEAAASQRDLNQALAEGGKYLEAELAAVENSNRKIIASMKERGASDQELATQQIKNDQLTIQSKQLALAAMKEQYNKAVVLNEENAQAYKQLGENIISLERDITASQTGIIEQTADKQRQAYLLSLKSQTAFQQARVDLAKRGSREQLQAEIDALNAAAQEQIKSNPNLTAGERAKIVSSTNRQIQDLNRDFRISELQKEKDFFDAAAAMAKEGSREQFLAKLESLHTQEKIDEENARKQIEDAEKLATALGKIRATFAQQQAEMIKQENFRVDSNVLQAEVARVQTNISQLQLAGADATNQKLLEAKKELVHRQALQEVLSIQNSIDTEENKRARIKEVYAKELADKHQLEKDKIAAEISEGKDLSLAIYDREIAKQNLVLNNAKKTEKEKRAAQEEVFRLTDARINAEELENAQLYDNGLETFAQYLAKKEALQTAHDENDAQREQFHQDRLNQIRDFAFQTFANLTNVMFSINQKGYADEEEKIKELHDTKRISDQEYNNQLKVLRRKQSEDEKAQAIFTTLINQGPMMIKGFQSGGFAGVAAAFTLFFALLSAVQGTKVPAYKTGEVNIDGPGTTTSDSIMARISRGESVINAAMTQKHEGALKAINEDRYYDYLLQHELPKLYSSLTMPQMPVFVQNSTASNTEKIDYEKLGDVIAQKLAENPQSHLSFDENGFMLAVKKGNDVIEYKNKKLNT